MRQSPQSARGTESASYSAHLVAGLGFMALWDLLQCFVAFTAVSKGFILEGRLAFTAVRFYGFFTGFGESYRV